MVVIGRAASETCLPAPEISLGDAQTSSLSYYCITLAHAPALKVKSWDSDSYNSGSWPLPVLIAAKRTPMQLKSRILPGPRKLSFQLA